MTYFLEKIFTLDNNYNLTPFKYGHIMIRPCDWDYDKILKFFHGKMPKSTYLTLGGQISIFNQKGLTKHSNDLEFNSIEEWLIWLELEKGISPSFEEIHITDKNTYTDYIVKTTDLKTNIILDDHMAKTIEMLKQKYKYQYVNQ